MNEQLKDKIIVFLVGILLGIFTTVAGALYVYKSIKGGSGIWAEKPQPIAKARQASYNPAQGLNLGFEQNNDMHFFKAAENSKFSISTSHPSAGNHSLEVVVPQGASYPGLEWEVYGKDAMDWKGKTSFSFNVYNNTEDIIPIEVKFKSGKNYPKKSYSVPMTLKPLDMNQVEIPIDQIKESLDIRQISYIKIFAKSPQVNYYLYFDEIKVK